MCPIRVALQRSSVLQHAGGVAVHKHPGDAALDSYIVQAQLTVALTGRYHHVVAHFPTA